jgi:hypothetical protein
MHDGQDIAGVLGTQYFQLGQVTPIPTPIPVPIPVTTPTAVLV